MHVIPAERIWASPHPPRDPVESSISDDLRPKSTIRRVVGVAQRQGGNVTRAQLLRLGVHPRAIARLVEKGWLIAIHAGVFAVGHLPRAHEERWWAAVLACGPGAALSHGSAAAAHGLLRPHPRVHVTTPAKRSRPGIANHTAGVDIVWVDGLPCTTVARALLDVAGSVPYGVLESAVRQAQVRGVLDVEALARLILECPRARGVRRLRKILGDPVLLAPTRSKAERVALRALLAAGFPWPQVGVEVHGETPDFSWPRLRKALEIDGPTHDTPVQRGRDIARDANLAAHGWEVVRVRDTDAANAPAAMRRVVDLGRVASEIDDSTGGGAAGAAGRSRASAA